MSNIYFNIKNEKEIELKINQRSYMFGASQRRSNDSKTKSSIQKTASTLNHFISYLADLEKQEEQPGKSDLSYFVLKMIKLQDLLSRNKMDNIATERVEEYGTNYREEKIRYFNEIIRNELINDNYLRKIISDYVYVSTKKNLVSKNVKVKLYYCDLHIYQCLAIYVKILYILYFRISSLSDYKKLVKQVIQDGSIYLNQSCIDLFPKEYSIIVDTSFMDRVFSYIEYYNEKKTKNHARLKSKFAPIGYSDESLSMTMLGNVLSSGLKNFCIRRYKSNKNVKLFDIRKHDYKNWGFISKATASWISRITSRSVQHEFGKVPKYIVNKKSPLVEVDGTSETAKYEILLEKKDKEHYQDMKKLKKYIVDSSYEKLSSFSKERIDELLEKQQDIRHLLNEFMVSLYLEQNYETNVIDLLTYGDFLVILFRVYERLEYYHLKHALVSDEGNRLNGVRIRRKYLQNLMSYKHINSDKTLDILNKCVSKTYVYTTHINGTKSIQYLNIKDDLINFIEKKGLFI